jgi:succinate semialdehyde reductase (NADPH)
MPRLLELAAGGRISLGDTISREVGLDEAAAIFDALDRGEVVGRAVVRM